MIDRELLVHLTIEDLPNGYPRDIAGAAGIDAFLVMLESFSGENIYIPKTALDQFKRRMVLTQHKSLSPKELARKLDLSENHVYRILREHGNGRRDQLTMFEESISKEGAS
jgi:Mor family transcriptional regulator